MLKDAWWQVTRWVVVLPTSLQAPELLSSWAPPPSFYIHAPGRGSNYNDSVSAPSRKTFTASNIKHQTTGGKNVSLINTFERWRRQMCLIARPLASMVSVWCCIAVLMGNLDRQQTTQSPYLYQHQHQHTIYTLQTWSLLISIVQTLFQHIRWHYLHWQLMKV